MSILKKMIDSYNDIKQQKDAKRADERYINDCLSHSQRNSHYSKCGEYDVYLCNPHRYDFDTVEKIHLTTDNIPTYVINFTSLEKAQNFMKNNFFMGPEHQKNVEINILSTVFSSALIIKPTNIDYEVHMEVDTEEVAQKLVKLFRRQYVDNKNLPKLIERKQAERKEIESKTFKSETEKLGIEF